MRFCIKWWLSGTKFVYYTAKRPNIGFESVSLCGADFRRHVEWSANICRGKVMRLHDFGQSKIAEFYRVISAEKYYKYFSQVSNSKDMKFLPFSGFKSLCKIMTLPTGARGFAVFPRPRTLDPTSGGSTP